MTIRTFKQQGRGYGATPAVVTARLDGVQVFSGPVSTLNQPIPGGYTPGSNYGVDMYFWEGDFDFEGTRELSITVTNSPLLLTDTLADYTTDNSAVFNCFYYYTVDGITIGDPLSNVKIDNVPMSRTNNLTGQWCWTIPAGSTLTATINIDSGYLPDPDNP